MVHFGVMVVVNIMLGLVTPPYGLLLFIMTRIAEVPLRDIVRDVLPFLWAMIGVAGADHLLPRARALAAAAARLPGLIEETDHEQADLRHQRPEPQPARQARAGNLRHDDARRDRGDVPRGGRRHGRSASTSRTSRARSSTGSTRRSTRAPASSSTRPAFTFTSIADPRRAEDVSRPDRRAPHLQHPPARGQLPPLARVEGRDRRHRRAGPARLSDRGSCDRDLLRGIDGESRP